jgi:hypothetical protein
MGIRMTRKTITDPTFGQIAFLVDAWDGLVPFEHDPSGTAKFGVHVWADESGPTDSQRATFEELKARYAALWPEIAKAMLRAYPALGSVDECGSALGPCVGCYIEYEATDKHEEFELIYEVNDEEGLGIFVRIAGWKVSDALTAQ